MSDFDGYYVRSSEPGLWTVGFALEKLGWQPESDHENWWQAEQRAAELNGDSSCFAYTSFEPGLWTVGECSSGRWDPVSDHDSPYEAAQAVIEHNTL